MRSVRVAGLSLGLLLLLVLLVVSAQAGVTKPQATKVKRTPHSVWAVAMDWPRVAYATGKDGNSETIRVWNMATEATSAVKSPKGFATHDANQIAIAGERLAWIRTVQLGNTELDHWLYTAPLGGSAHLLKRMLGYTDTDCGLGGPQMGGLVSSAKIMAVSTWIENSNGTVSSNKRLDLITPKRLRTIATGPDAILSESADGGHIAVLPMPPPSLAEGYCEGVLPTSAVIYSTQGTLLRTIALASSRPEHSGLSVRAQRQRGRGADGRAHEPNGPAWVTLSVYDWTTGALRHTWPIAIPQYPGEVSFTAHGELAAVEGPFRLHLVDLNTGKDVTDRAAPGTPLSPRARSARSRLRPQHSLQGAGKLVFVPMAKLLALAS